jgi:hypothetical protein
MAGRIGVSMVSFVPRIGSALSANLNASGVACPFASSASAFSMARSRVSRTSCVADLSFQSSA